LPQPSQRVALLRDLADALAGETDAALRTATAQAVRAAIAHCLRWTILRALQRSDAEYRTDRESLAEVRVCAIEIVQRTGGPDAVPFMLAWMAAPPERMRENAKRFDLDHYVRLRLIHLCGQLDLTRASKSIRLPGREAWEPASPIDYLCDTLLDVLTRTPFYTALRIPALEALCRCVGRPFDLDDSWVRGWYEEYRRRT
jgi:hypothetical protein